MSKLTEILKAAGEYCTIGAGVASIFISVIGAFVALPVFLTFVVAAGIGLVCGLIGSYHEYRHLEQEEQNGRQTSAQQETIIHEFKSELDEIKRDLELHHESTVKHRGHVKHFMPKFHFFTEQVESAQKQKPCNEPSFGDRPRKALN